MPRFSDYQLTARNVEEEAVRRYTNNAYDRLDDIPQAKVEAILRQEARGGEISKQLVDRILKDEKKAVDNAVKDVRREYGYSVGQGAVSDFYKRFYNVMSRKFKDAAYKLAGVRMGLGEENMRFCRRCGYLDRGVRFDISPLDGNSWRARVEALVQNIKKGVAEINSLAKAWEQCEAKGQSTWYRIYRPGAYMEVWEEAKRALKNLKCPEASEQLERTSKEAKNVSDILKKACRKPNLNITAKELQEWIRMSDALDTISTILHKAWNESDGLSYLLFCFEWNKSAGKPFYEFKKQIETELRKISLQ